MNFSEFIDRIDDNKEQIWDDDYETMREFALYLNMYDFDEHYEFHPFLR